MHELQNKLSDPLSDTISYTLSDIPIKLKDNPLLHWINQMQQTKKKKYSKKLYDKIKEDKKFEMIQQIIKDIIKDTKKDMGDIETTKNIIDLVDLRDLLIEKDFSEKIFVKSNIELIINTICKYENNENDNDLNTLIISNNEKLIQNIIIQKIKEKFVKEQYNDSNIIEIQKLLITKIKIILSYYSNLTQSILPKMMTLNKILNNNLMEIYNINKTFNALTNIKKINR